MDETPEEIAAELAASQVVVKEDEVRVKVIEEFGFDPDIDQERIDKLVAKEVEGQKKLSAAIGQKIKHRTEAEELRKKVPVTPSEKKEETQDVGKTVNEILAQRDLEDMNLSDSLKKDIADWAKFKNISVRQAARDPIFVPQIAEYEKQAKIDEATTSRTNRSSGKAAPSMDSMPDFDMKTQKGRDEYDAWKDALKKAGN